MGLLPETKSGAPLPRILRRMITASGITAVLLLVIGTPGPVKGLKTDFGTLSFDRSLLPINDIMRQVKQVNPEAQKLIGSKKNWLAVRDQSVRQLSQLQNGNLLKYFSDDLTLEQLVHSVLLSSPNEIDGLLTKAGLELSAVDSVCPDESTSLQVASQLLNSAEKNPDPADIAEKVGSSALRALATGCVLRFVKSNAPGNVKTPPPLG